jgi:hypothetical protein
MMENECMGSFSGYMRSACNDSREELERKIKELNGPNYFLMDKTNKRMALAAYEFCLATVDLPSHWPIPDQPFDHEDLSEWAQRAAAECKKVATGECDG